MQLAALKHRTESENCFVIDHSHIKIRLHTAKDDVEKVESLLKSLTIVLSNVDLLNAMRLSKNEKHKVETILNQIDLLLDHVQEGLVDSSEIDNPHFQ